MTPFSSGCGGNKLGAKAVLPDQLVQNYPEHFSPHFPSMMKIQLVTWIIKEYVR